MTLVELLVAMSLVSILLLMFFSSNLFVQRLVSRWKESNSLAIHGEMICATIEKDLERSVSLRTEDSLTFKIRLESGDSVIYRLDSLALWRNDRRLNERGFLCQDLKLERKFFEKRNSFDIFVNGSLMHRVELVAATIVMQYKAKQETFSVLGRLKNEAEIR